MAGPAVDYTVNAAVGIPDMTGPPTGGPVNHVLPAWDLMAGAYGAMALLAAERLRRDTGQGQEIRLPLAQLAARHPSARSGRSPRSSPPAPTGRDTATICSVPSAAISSPADGSA